MTQIELAITGIGAAADGLAIGADGTRFFIPGALPGETVRATPGARRGDGVLAQLDAVLVPSADRVEPPCPHFGPCGGCATQHWALPPYADWKRERLAEALSRAGFPDAPVAATRVSPPNSRRRADLALRRRLDGSVVLGFHGRGDSSVADLAVCLVLDPVLVALFEPLRVLLRGLSAFRREGSAMLNLLDTGPDLLLRLDGPPNATDRAAMAAFAAAHGMPRIAGGATRGGATKGAGTTRGAEGTTETMAQLGPVAIQFAGVPVAPAPGAFLQATPQGEAAIVEAVLAGLPAKLANKARVAELHAGVGTLSFPIAARVRVSAYESATEAYDALDLAARKSGGRVVANRRDLVRQPLTVKELDGFAAVVLDPPFSGAVEQMPALARCTGPKRIIYVSCNPAALARDGKILQLAGWRVAQATPIDQFLWSTQLEAVVVFERG